MKKYFIYLIVIFFLLFLSGCNIFSDSIEEDIVNDNDTNDISDSERDDADSDSERNNKVIINDQNLLLLIRNHLGIEEGDITKDDMLKIREINLSRSGIEDLTGMEYAYNATFLDLRENSISDIEPLKDLDRLERLILDRNRIKDISAVSSMVSLEALELRENLIEDITNVNWANLSNLVFLDIRYNFINLNDTGTERVLDNLYSSGVNVMHDPIEPILDDW